MSCWERDVLLLLQLRQSLVVTGTRKLPLPTGCWLIGQSGRGKCPSQWVEKDSRPRHTHSPPRTLRFAELILTVDIKELQLTWEWALLEMLLSNKIDACVRIHKVVSPALTAFFFLHIHPKLPKCKALASECVSASSNRDQAAEQILDAQCTMGQISKIMSVHTSYILWFTIPRCSFVDFNSAFKAWVSDPTPDFFFFFVTKLFETLFTLWSQPINLMFFSQN